MRAIDGVAPASFLRIALATALVLLIPLVAMQFSGEVNWNAADFIVMGALVFGTGLAFQLIATRVRRPNRLAVGLALALAFLFVWAELAVGVAGTPFAGD